MSHRILLVEDEEILRESLAELLEGDGYTVIQAQNGNVAHQAILEEPVDLIVSDLRMPEMDGLELLTRIRQVSTDVPVIFMTAFGTVDSAVSAMKQGAWDYLLKPVQFEDLVLKIQRALEFGEAVRDRRRMTDQLAESSTYHNLVSQDSEMMRLFELMRKLSEVRSNVLIVGESGTGKELVARAIHYKGITRDKPFVAVNCGAIPDSLIESELFGHRRGAFTGAIREKTGFFEAATGGTLLLDELSNLPRHVQATLLRVLEERVIIRVGDTRPRPIDIRVIGASNKDLEKMVRAGEFRDDLLYRLNVVKLSLPPLRQRKSDIPLLVHHFLEKFVTQMNKDMLGVSSGAMRALLNHDWPGNVRELQNVLERAVIFATGGEITVEDLPFGPEQPGNDGGDDLKEALRQYERQHIISSLRRHEYDKTLTAERLGIGMSSLYRKFEELGIPKDLQQVDEAGRS